MMTTTFDGSSSTREDSDEAPVLLDGARAGHEGSWSVIFSRFQGPLLRIASTYGFDNATASDMVQQTWLAAYSHVGDLRDAAALGGWLRTILRRECLKELKRRRRETLSSDVELDARPRMFVCNELEQPEAAVIQRDEKSLLHAAAQASLSQRDLDLLGLITATPRQSYVEMSRRLGMPVGSIGPMRGRCIARLRAELGNLGMDRL